MFFYIEKIDFFLELLYYKKNDKQRRGFMEYKCNICGYIYNEDTEEFSELPNDWTCPLCGATKDAFEEV